MFINFSKNEVSKMLLYKNIICICLNRVHRFLHSKPNHFEGNKA